MHVCNSLWPKDKLAAGRAIPREAIMQLKCCSCALPCFVWNHIVQHSAFSSFVTLIPMHVYATRHCQVCFGVGGAELTHGQAFIGEECEDDKTRYTTNTIVPKPKRPKGGREKERKEKSRKNINVSPFNQTIGSWLGASLSLSVGKGLVVCQDCLGVVMVVNF